MRGTARAATRTASQDKLYPGMQFCLVKPPLVGCTCEWLYRCIRQHMHYCDSCMSCCSGRLGSLGRSVDVGAAVAVLLKNWFTQERP